MLTDYLLEEACEYLTLETPEVVAEKCLPELLDTDHDITADHLVDCHIGKLVKRLSKRNGDVSRLAGKLLSRWRTLFQEEDCGPPSPKDLPQKDLSPSPVPSNYSPITASVVAKRLLTRKSTNLRRSSLTHHFSQSPLVKRRSNVELTISKRLSASEESKSSSSARRSRRRSHREF